MTNISIFSRFLTCCFLAPTSTWLAAQRRTWRSGSATRATKRWKPRASWSSLRGARCWWRSWRRPRARLRLRPKKGMRWETTRDHRHCGVLILGNMWNMMKYVCDLRWYFTVSKWTLGEFTPKLWLFTEEKQWTDEVWNHGVWGCSKFWQTWCFPGKTSMSLWIYNLSGRWVYQYIMSYQDVNGGPQ